MTAAASWTARATTGTRSSSSTTLTGTRGPSRRARRCARRPPADPATGGRTCPHGRNPSRREPGPDPARKTSPVSRLRRSGARRSRGRPAVPAVELAAGARVRPALDAPPLVIEGHRRGAFALRGKRAVRMPVLHDGKPPRIRRGIHHPVGHRAPPSTNPANRTYVRDATRRGRPRRGAVSSLARPAGRRDGTEDSMADYERSTTVGASADAVFAFLADPENLAEYVGPITHVDSIAIEGDPAEVAASDEADAA